MSIKTKKTVLVLVLVACVITIIGTVSFAYFTATGASVNQTATISTAKVSAVFSDADTGVNATLNFGESFSKKFTITNDGNVPVHVKMYWKDLVNTYTKESLSYTLAKSDSGDVGSYTVFVGGGETKSLVPQSASASTKLLAGDIEVPVGTTYYELTVTLNYLSDVNQDSDLTAKFYSWFKLEDINYDDNLALQTLQALNLTSNGALTTDFGNPASTAKSAGVYELTDENDTISYYFRGPVENNYVKFGKWMDSSNANYGSDMYWRIVRVNGDGSLRMIYAGTSAYSNNDQGADTFIGTSVFNSSNNDAKYVGYMYSPAGTTASTASSLANPNEESSTIKGVLETWYEKNLEDSYGQYISKDAIFCYDRSTPGRAVTGLSSDSGLGYGTRKTAYGAYARLGVQSINYNNIHPQFICPQENDKFTVAESSTGNKALSKPIGLITADEIVAAGSGKYKTASDYYLKRTKMYWSGSPYFNDPSALLFTVTINDGSLNRQYCNYNSSLVAPVINLTAEYVETLVGDGTIGNEYRNPNA